MRRRAIGQLVRETGPRSHTQKAGTPTMGGLVLLGLWVVAVVCLQPWRRDARSIAFVLTAGTLYGGIGWLDDWLSIRKRHSTGLTVVQKLGLASLASLLLYFVFTDVVAAPLALPFTSLTVSLPPVAVFFVTWLVFLATTNSLNLADGLDGLAGGLALLIVCGLLVLAPTRGHLLLGFPLIAALLGFLWTNVHPAALFLGDVGSFAIGGIIAALALASGLSLVLPLLAGVLVLEAAAVLLQVSLFRLTGKRLFKMAPLHHHFEAAVAPQERKCLIRSYEWPETKVTARFLILQALFIAVAVWAGSFPKA
ncbi:phospho-N-acetylmuramoyl-pentapeptide-transferase [Candidatus Bipolaricaulota bacterium]|nr:phospho-N-acetylmuramoyl-pentapeptide-transferase [Candidatus Bipolaricaulota bacterium]